MSQSPLLWLLPAALLAACRTTEANPPEPSDAEVQEALEAGETWEVLFDGESLSKWRGFRQGDVPEGWAIEDGCIALVGSGGGDLITRDVFASFELTLEWKISPRGNSGILFHVTEDQEQTYFTGPEMQVLDNAVFDGEVDMLHAAGANYALHAPPRDDSRLAGEFNHVRILVDGDHVEHWLNGMLQCQYSLGSEKWRELVAASKFARMPGYGAQRVGHIALQDHGDAVWYRNIRIRRF